MFSKKTIEKYADLNERIARYKVRGHLSRAGGIPIELRMSLLIETGDTHLGRRYSYRVEECPLLIRVSGHTSRAGGIPIELRNVPLDKGKWTHFSRAGGIPIELRNVPS